MKHKNKKRGLLSMLGATLASSLLGNLLAGTAVKKAGKRTNRAGQDF